MEEETVAGVGAGVHTDVGNGVEAIAATGRPNVGTAELKVTGALPGVRVAGGLSPKLIWLLLAVEVEVPPKVVAPVGGEGKAVLLPPVADLGTGSCTEGNLENLVGGEGRGSGEVGVGLRVIFG